jgi:hypothetical protein
MELRLRAMKPARIKVFIVKKRAMALSSLGSVGYSL